LEFHGATEELPGANCEFHGATEELPGANEIRGSEFHVAIKA
jgi:hypothetical protein